MPGMNPFQSLVQYAEYHELLRQIIIATAALSEPGEQEKLGRSLWHPLQDTYQDSIKAKLRALSLLAEAIQTGDASSDIVSTCVLLFVHFELMRPESTESRIHLKGAHALFSHLRPSKRAIQTVRNTVISDSILFDTMELAIGHTRPWSSSIMYSLLPLFESIDSSNHITFPLEMLHTFTGACKAIRLFPLGMTLDTETIAEFSIAMERIEAIDARGWAESFNRIHLCTSCPSDVEIRMHLCKAHKAASIIFLARATGLMPATSLDTHQGRILEHLEQVPFGQSLFKATSWPTFIAGLEASEERVASGLTDRLQFMCSIVPYDFARRALRMLKSARAAQSVPVVGSATGSNRSREWIQGLRMIVPALW
ncbi:hypothetical protein E8E11_009903 [Didymella keratinophila]|nr:hypothetical protein E8E11_009903 [Didymella keratinophila]